MFARPLAGAPAVTETASSPGRAFSKPPLGVESFEAAWRILNETYFDPDFNGLDWDSVRAELRPKAESARTMDQVREVIKDMLNRLGGSHLALIPGETAVEFEDADAPNDQSGPGDADDGNEADEAEQGAGDVGLEVRIAQGQALVTRVDPDGPASKAGVKPGWIIRSVEGRQVVDLLKPWAGELELRRTQFMAWKLVTGRISGDPGTTVRMEFLDGSGQPLSVVLSRRQPRGEPAKLGDFPTLHARFNAEEIALPSGGAAGVIRFNVWMIPVVRALDSAIDRFRRADGIIMDLRGNLGGMGGMILGISGHFLNERVSLGTLKMRGSDLHFFSNPRRVNAAGQRVAPYTGPLAILIDGMSLSASEIFAGGMQAVGRARVFGETSGGQALPAIWDRLPNGDVLYHPFGDFIIASGARLEGRGVSPDETAVASREDLVAGRDLPMLAAMRWIDEQNRKRVISNPKNP